MVVPFCRISVVNLSKTSADGTIFPSLPRGSTPGSVIQRPISFHCSSSCSSPPSPQPPPPWPSRWPWSQARWLFPPCRAGCRPTTAMPRPAAAGPDRSRWGSRRCGGGERKGSCWRRGEVRSHSSRGFLVEQQQTQVSKRVQQSSFFYNSLLQEAHMVLAEELSYFLLWHQGKLDNKRKMCNHCFWALEPNFVLSTDDFLKPDSVMCVAVVCRLTKVLNLRWCRLFPSRARIARLCRGARAPPSIREMLLLLRLSTCADGRKISEVEETHTAVFTRLQARQQIQTPLLHHRQSVVV